MLRGRGHQRGQLDGQGSVSLDAAAQAGTNAVPRAPPSKSRAREGDPATRRQADSTMRHDHVSPATPSGPPTRRAQGQQGQQGGVSRDQSAGTAGQQGEDAGARGEPGDCGGAALTAEASMMLIAAGPSTAMKRHGRMQKISGTTILTGTFWAFSSAHWRRFTRISVDWTRSTWPTGMPNASACTMALTKERISGDVLRSPSARRASERPCRSASPAASVRTRRPGVPRCSWPPADRRIETQAGLHRDGQQVDGVGQLALHLVGAVVACE